MVCGDKRETQAIFLVTNVVVFVVSMSLLVQLLRVKHAFNIHTEPLNTTHCNKVITAYTRVAENADKEQNEAKNSERQNKVFTPLV